MPGQPGFQPPGVVSQYSAAPPMPSDGIDSSDLNISLRKIAFRFLVVLVFIRFSMLHQLLTYKLGANLFLLYIFGLPPVLGFLFTGGFRRAVRFRVALYWLLFAGCLLLACIFSTWRGGSAAVVVTYLRTDFLMLFLIAGLTVGLVALPLAMASRISCKRSRVRFIQQTLREGHSPEPAA